MSQNNDLSNPAVDPGELLPELTGGNSSGSLAELFPTIRSLTEEVRN